MKKAIAVLVCGLFLMGFSWGQSEEKSAPEVKKQSYGYTQQAMKKEAAKPARKNVAEPAAAGVPDAKAISAAAKFMSEGTPEEKQARLESLRRLSSALNQSQNK